MIRDLQISVYVLILLSMARRIWEKLSYRKGSSLLHYPDGVKMFKDTPGITVQGDRLLAYVSFRHGEFVILAVFDTDCNYSGVEKFVKDLNAKVDCVKVLAGRAKAFAENDWIKAYPFDQGIGMLGTDTYIRIAGWLNAMKGKPEYPRYEVPLASKV